jgi:hypothetical protein
VPLKAGRIFSCQRAIEPWPAGPLALARSAFVAGVGETSDGCGESMPHRKVRMGPSYIPEGT